MLCIGESLSLLSLMERQNKFLPSVHFKRAIILWKCGALHETINMTSAALENYSEAVEIFEKLIYGQNDIRTKQALSYLLREKYACDDVYGSCNWLESSILSPLAMFSAATGREKWRCILQRFKFLKMTHINNQWQFHLTIEWILLNSELCTILFDEMLQVCNDQMHSDESNTSLDTSSIICCFEFISHWYLVNDEPIKSLLFRQWQLTLETKLFNEDPQVAWSLWFIGLIFEKTKEYDFALGYLNRALRILEPAHSIENSDVENLKECISQVQHAISIVDSPEVGKSLFKITRNQEVKGMPTILQMPFHID